MLKGKVDVSVAVPEKSKRVKFHPNRYLYSSKLQTYFQLRGVKTSTVYKTLKNHGVPENTIKTFLTGSHIPSSYLSHLVEDIWGIRFGHEDFEEQKNG
ncbi:MAG: hypothetical protein A2293_07985 [Elusimicrobia bacterium RIFOXYB2_FULL_49_7]|nr:MAG: hypothetical protein A2293_07985 [Elusimicrobia bacterium RIFOXYB2_FULL_49_7]